MRHWIFKLTSLAVPMIWLFPAPGLTQDVEEIVVIANPIIDGNQVDNFGATTTVVTQEQIDDLNAVDLGTALRRTPGVTISRYNSIGSFGGAEGGGVFIRGMGSSRPGGEIKTFIDGIPMYMSVWNHPLLDLLSIDTADSVQIYKSPQPHIFGNAFAAVNIDPKRQRTEGYQTNLRMAGGSYSTMVESAEHGGKVGTLDYYLGQSFRISDGHREDSDGQLTNYFGRIGVELGPNWYASFFGLSTDNSAMDPGVDGNEAATRNGEYKTSATMGIATLNHDYTNFEGSLKVFLNTGSGDWYDQRPPDKDLFNDFTFSGVRFNEKVRPWTGGEMTLGMDWDVITGEISSKNAANVAKEWEGPTQRIFSPYAAFSQLFGNKDGLHLIPSAGLRSYTHSDLDDELAPHTGLILGYKDTQFHGGYSHGVNYPGLDVVLMSEYVNPMLKKSWEDLEAETLDHYEVGISQAWDRVRTDLTLFWDYGKNRYLVIPPPPPPPVYANLGDYRTHGVEATISLAPTDNLSVFLGVTLLGSDKENHPYTPDATFSVGLNWRFLERFRLSMDSQYVSEMYVGSQARRYGAVNTAQIDSYFLVNGKLSYELPKATLDMDAEIFLSVENFIDECYEYLPGYPMPGMNGMLGVALKF